MPKARIYKCSACARSHPRPTGKHCQWLNAELPEEREVQTTNAADIAETLRSIKTQMESLGQRMGEMEKSKTTEVLDQRQADVASASEPTNGAAAAPPVANDVEPNVPSVRDLRRDFAVEKEVNRRLAELDILDETYDDRRHGSPRKRGKRSGAARTVQDAVVHDIDWPHFHIYAPPGAEPTTYPQLTIPEFTFGYLQMVDQPDAKFNRAIMWDLLKDIMEDAVEYPWENVKNFFWIVGSHVENDRMEWGNSEAISKLRAKHSQKYEIPTKLAAVSAQPQPVERLRYCMPYQSKTCTEKGDHGGLRHMCAHCYRVKSVPYPHPETDCRRKSGEPPKNAKGGE